MVRTDDGMSPCPVMKTIGGCTPWKAASGIQVVYQLMSNLRSTGRPAGTRRIVLDVLRFADDTTGKVLLTGGWSLPPAGSDVPLLRQQVHLSEPTDPSGYANQVAAMSRLLGQLAEGIARRLSVPHEEHAT